MARIRPSLSRRPENDLFYGSICRWRDHRIVRRNRTSVQDSTKNAPATITIAPQSTSSVHPRILLDAPTLSTLRSRLQANSAEWKALKATCDSYFGGTVSFINGNGYPDRPSVR